MFLYEKSYYSKVDRGYSHLDNKMECNKMGESTKFQKRSLCIEAKRRRALIGKYDNSREYEMICILQSDNIAESIQK